MASEVADLIDGALLKAPFPAFGGKSRVVDLVWERFDGAGGSRGMTACRNFVEPFAFSSVMTIKRRGGAGAVETINDLNAYVANFWRAVQRDPDSVAAHADWPVNETDLHARHRWLVNSGAANDELRRVREDPEHFDARIAGWWCWGACCWIGSGWCEDRNAVPQDPSEQMPHMDPGGRLVASPPAPGSKRCKLSGNGIGSGVHANPAAPPDGKAPHLDSRSTGRGRPQLADEFARGRGVNGNDRLGNGPGACEARRAWLRRWMMTLADRLRPVRVCCGHWDRVCDSPSTMTRLGVTGVFLDPPYRKHLADGTANRTSQIYANDRSQDVGAMCDEVQAWCLKWGDNPDVRIALCGLEGEYPLLDALVKDGGGAGGAGRAGGWDKVAWKSGGGYGNRSERGKENAARERIWFSPYCLRPGAAGGLFDA